MRISTMGGLTIALASIACHAETVAPPSGFESLRVEGRMVGAGGAPVLGGVVFVELWRTSNHKAARRPVPTRQAQTR